LKLSEIKGKSIELAVKLICSIIHFLQNAHKSILQDGKEFYKYLLVDLVQIVLDIFKTSSVEVFNTKFTTLNTIKELEEFGDTNSGDMSSFNLKDVEQLLCMAESQYNILFQKGEWTGINTPGLSSFTATGGGHCWNCGKTSHMLDDCPHSCDNSAIEHNKQAFWHGGRGYGHSQGHGHGRGRGRGCGCGRYSGGSDDSSEAVRVVPAGKTGLFARPSKKECNHHDIKGSVWTYDHSKDHWWQNEHITLDAPPKPAQVSTDSSQSTTSTMTSELLLETPGQSVAEASCAATHKKAAHANFENILARLSNQFEEMSSHK